MSEREPQRTLEVEGVEYCLGSVGSLVLACDACGEEHFRGSENYFGFPCIGPNPGKPEWHKCMNPECPERDETREYAGHQMQPIRVDELESKWRPLWYRLGMRPYAEDGSLWKPIDHP